MGMENGIRNCSIRTKQKSVTFDTEKKEKTFKSNEALDQKKWKGKQQNLKTGPFSQDEVDTLKHAMCRYCFVDFLLESL